MIYVGTSGFSFDDWVGTVYPENIKKSQMLGYYWMDLGFNSVELNFTYYTLPSYRTMVSLLRKTPNDFKFSVKVPKNVSHEGWKADLDEEVIEKYLRSVEPMESEGRFLTHLVQFPYSFKFSKKGLEYIKQISNIFRPMAVEFRHDSWDRDEVYENLKGEGITFVIVDEPRLKHLFPYKIVLTSDTAYFRFHGRNNSWFDPKVDRYDYLYSEEDLMKFAEDVKGVAEKVKTVMVYFNNCHKGKAAKNALKLKELLGI